VFDMPSDGETFRVGFRRKTSFLVGQVSGSGPSNKPIENLRRNICLGCTAVAESGRGNRGCSRSLMRNGAYYTEVVARRYAPRSAQICSIARTCRSPAAGLWPKGVLISMSLLGLAAVGCRPGASRSGVRRGVTVSRGLSASTAQTMTTAWNADPQVTLNTTYPQIASSWNNRPAANWSPFRRRRGQAAMMGNWSSATCSPADAYLYWSEWPSPSRCDGVLIVGLTSGC